LKYLLDTNICIYLINSKSEKLIKQFKTLDIGQLAISSISVAQLRYGASKSQATEKNNFALDQFLIPLEIVDFDTRSAASYGEVRTNLESKGKPIGPLDTLIAAQALAYGLTLITNNVREFKRVSGLKVENWT
jgi:tRNA(fMet)-specific endonuclease VapC